MPPWDEVGQNLYDLQRRMRPQAARWITGSFGGMKFDPGQRYPVTDIVYDWLHNDLSRLELVSGMLRHSTDQIARWE
jgi:hypothetical protein